MKRRLIPVFLTLFSLIANAELIEDAPKECSYCEAWNTPQTPYRIHGNTWYVGTAGLASILVVTDAGLILIDGALAQSAGLIVENIRQIGFDPLDIKYILNSHAHYDHAGGVAALQAFTGAKVLVNEESLAVFQSGEVAVNDPQYNFGVDANRFPPVQNVASFGDTDTLTLGDTSLTAHATPGHTAGGTTWAWLSCEESACLNIVYADSLSAVSADDYRFSDESLSPNGAEQISASTSLIRALPCDILLAPHPFLIEMEEKRALLDANPETNPFIEADACSDYADYFDAWLARRLEDEALNSQE